MKSKKAFTRWQMELIQNRVRRQSETEELSMLVYLLIKTRLKVSELLGWFNKDVKRRIEYLEQTNESLSLLEYLHVPILFPKTHQAYLSQWKRYCQKWIGVNDATFEMLKRNAIEVSRDVDRTESNEEIKLTTEKQLII